MYATSNYTAQDRESDGGIQARHTPFRWVWTKSEKPQAGGGYSFEYGSPQKEEVKRMVVNIPELILVLLALIAFLADAKQIATRWQLQSIGLSLLTLIWLLRIITIR
jgi:hypothetical protein